MLKVKRFIYVCAYLVLRIVSPRHRKQWARLTGEIKRLTPKEKRALLLLDPSLAYNNEYFLSDQFEDQNEWSNKISQVIDKHLKPKSVVDVGCGRGLFLRHFHEKSIRILGIEGSSSAIKNLVVPKNKIIQTDLRNVFQKTNARKYDIAISFEVAEHLEREFAGVFVYNLTTLSNTILFTAAHPGWSIPHPHHPNEQPYEYWDTLFEFYGYKEDTKTTNRLRRELAKLHLPLNVSHYSDVKVYKKR